MISHRRPEEDLHNKVLNAIQGALREEKVSRSKRILKVALASIFAFALVSVPFLSVFQTQITWVWKLALVFWAIYFLIGFYLWFKPQPRLMIPGVFSPFVVAKLFLVSTCATIVQVLICPSFVFLSSPLDWNPLLHLTDFLMQTGGMNLCMGFCGFIFSGSASAVAIFSIRNTAKASDLRTNAIVLSILSLSQIPILLIQVLTDELRSFAGFWVLGMLLGFLSAIGFKNLISHLNQSKENEIRS